ncbi:hypothetical protein FKM82_021935 [Ascaphus truei]
MELMRGKTFIKSYAQKPPQKMFSAGVKEKSNVMSEINLREWEGKKNDSDTRTVSSGQSFNGTDNIHCHTFVRKSKTHDCVTRENKAEQVFSDNGRGRFPTSISFSGVETSLNTTGKMNNTHTMGQSTYNQHIIDYRNFVPHMPFVPSVAKSFPRKRISLKRSKKGLKDIFNIKKNKEQRVISLVENNKGLHPMICEMEKIKRVGKHHLKQTSEKISDESAAHDFSDNEMLFDSIEFCHNLCEDIASLKSFDSFTGCGEIFADESSASLDIENCKDGKKLKFVTKENLIAGNYQGGVEQLASPGKTEARDFTQFCGKVNTSTRSLYSIFPFASKLSLPNDTIAKKDTNHQDLSTDQFSNSTYNDFVASNENSAGASSPISTSDEGYYDSYFPGLEDEKKTESPLSFPRESYSGDALFELFCDDNETKLNPVPDDELSVSQHNADIPMSMYSFCVGAEENMASQPTDDLVGDETLQSSWKGRECLLKLCDTELSLTMGIVNWLKKTGTNMKIQITNPNSCSSDQSEYKQTPATEDNNKSKSIICNGSIHRNKEREYISQTVKAESHGKENEGSDYKHLIISTSQRKEALICMLESNSCFSENKLITWPPVDYHVSNHKSLIIKNFNNDAYISNELELFNPYLTTLAHMDSMHILSSNNALSSFKDDRHKPVHVLSVRCVTSSTSSSLTENDKCILKIVEQCSNQVASLQITHGVESKHKTNPTCSENILQPYNISQNYKKPIGQQDHDSQQNTDYLEANKKHLKILHIRDTTVSPWTNNAFKLTKCKQDSKYHHDPNQGYKSKAHMKQETFLKT